MAQMMAMMREACQRSEESTRSLQEAKIAFKVEMEELRKENAQLRKLLTKPVHIEQKAENTKDAKRRWSKFMSKWVKKLE